MKTFTKMLIAATFVVIVAAFIPVAKADEGNLATELTIQHPMQIGNLILTPGTYILRSVDIWAPDVISVYNTNAQHYDGMIMGTPVFRSRASEKSTFIFEQASKGAPEALQYWYYPDRNYGIRFPVPHMKITGTTEMSAHTAG